MSTVPSFIYLSRPPKKLSKSQGKGPSLETDCRVVEPPIKQVIFQIFSTETGATAKFAIEIRNCSASQDASEGDAYWVSWMNDDGFWTLYSDEHSKRSVWTAWTKDDHLVCLPNIKSRKYPAGTTYMVDLRAMQQTNVFTARRRPVRLALAMKASSRHLPHLCPERAIKYLIRRQEGKCLGMMENEIILHELALTRLISPQYVQQAILGSIRPHKLRFIQANIHLKTDVAENKELYMWDLFLDSFQQAVQQIPNYLGHLWRFSLNPEGAHHPLNPFAATNTNGIWRFVFHPLSHLYDSNALMKSGIQPSLGMSPTHADWFGLTGTVTEFYCKPVAEGVVSMLVFLVLMPRNFNHSQARVVHVKKAIDNLPVASITLSLVDDDSSSPSCSLWKEMNDGAHAGGERSALSWKPRLLTVANRIASFKR